MSENDETQMIIGVEIIFRLKSAKLPKTCSHRLVKEGADVGVEIADLNS